MRAVNQKTHRTNYETACMNFYFYLEKNKHWESWTTDLIKSKKEIRNYVFRSLSKKAFKKRNDIFVIKNDNSKI
jgi:hypothetical protein